MSKVRSELIPRVSSFVIFQWWCSEYRMVRRKKRSGTQSDKKLQEGGGTSLRVVNRERLESTSAKGGALGDLSSFKILSILALEFGERGVRGEGKTGEFKEFTLLIGIFLEEQSWTTPALTPISCINSGTFIRPCVKRAIAPSTLHRV